MPNIPYFLHLLGHELVLKLFKALNEKDSTILRSSVKQQKLTTLLVYILITNTCKIIKGI